VSGRNAGGNIFSSNIAAIGNTNGPSSNKHTTGTLLHHSIMAARAAAAAMAASVARSPVIRTRTRQLQRDRHNELPVISHLIETTHQSKSLFDCCAKKFFSTSSSSFTTSTLPLGSVSTWSRSSGSRRRRRETYSLVRQPPLSLVSLELTSLQRWRRATRFSKALVSMSTSSSDKHHHYNVSPNRRNSESSAALPENDASSSSPTVASYSSSGSSSSSSFDNSFYAGWYSPPNLITMGRILGTPVIGYWIIQGQEDPQQLKYALAGCVVAATSDYLDGYLAKNYNMATVFGSWLDPIADKFLVNTLAISLWYIGLDPANNPMLSMGGGGSGEAAISAAATAITAAEFVPVAYSIPTYVIVLWLAKDVSLVAGGILFLRQQKHKLQKQDDEQSNLSSPYISSSPSRSLPSNSSSKIATETNEKMPLVGSNEKSGIISPLQVQPTTIGKVNTALQFTTLGVALGMGIVLTGSGDAGNVVAMVHGLDTTLPVLLQGLCVLSSATTVSSTISYMGNIRKLL
jgi:hypothetical protein